MEAKQQLGIVMAARDIFLMLDLNSSSRTLEVCLAERLKVDGQEALPAGLDFASAAKHEGSGMIFAPPRAPPIVKTEINEKHDSLSHGPHFATAACETTDCSSSPAIARSTKRIDSTPDTIQRRLGRLLTRRRDVDSSRCHVPDGVWRHAPIEGHRGARHFLNEGRGLEAPKAEEGRLLMQTQRTPATKSWRLMQHPAGIEEHR